jgi:hypothetical protein
VTLLSELEVCIDYCQVYIYDEAAPGADLATDSVLRALDDAWDSGRTVGAHGGLIDLCAPVQWNFNALMRLEVRSAEPTGDSRDWDHVVDIDLDVPSGRLSFAASGGLHTPAAPQLRNAWGDW